jgi:predicted Zn-dependent protease
MNPHDDEREEKELASHLAAADKDAAPPDKNFLADLRARSSEAFASSSASSPVTSPAPRKRPMFFRRLLEITIAASVLLGVALTWWLSPAPVLALGQVLDKTEEADTIHLRLRDRQGKQLDYWHTRKPERSRWDDFSGNYRVAVDSKYWVVSEAANEARPTKLPALARRPVLQFLDSLGINEKDIASARPSERVNEDGREVVVYHLTMPRAGGQFIVEARVDPDTWRLRSLRTWLENATKKALFGELRIVAFDEPIAADKFLIADSLSEDGRIGKITDVQGIVSVKPVMHDRFTPVYAHLVLRPGDLVRTDARGANATAIRLLKKTGLILGPKTLVELVSTKQVRLIEGELEITPSPGAPIEVLGPVRQQVVVKERMLFHADMKQFVRAEKDPPWLLGFKGATGNETLGSLVANVDGRNVPLTVGYHKVSVDIRDQIARTTIEESFVNHTNSQLEGVFYFPLPQDASISGFGMWIGDNYVEADVVEKQRAREIYETILRERRDPGLLEWTGGNIFKARVFPIFAHSEKRIKITYTQVLPLKGNRYRYSYALQSELLQLHPLRELAIDVKVNSVVPLKSVTCATHPTRNDQTLHSGHVEFTAQEYVPTRDFEVVVETEGRQSDVVVIPHRRGDDGYFMLQLTPPGQAGDWDRPLLPDGEPLHLVILADTSASIDASQRATQAAFLGSLLGSLGKKDTFNLATCDVTCDWAFPQPAPADEDHVAAARDHLAKRTSLGWTNLDVAFTAAMKQAGPKTHVIYVGDGIVTAPSTDPVAFAQRLRRMGTGHPGTFHAVTLGSSYESGVLKAIASLGGGSMRKITGEQSPSMVAGELLGEIAQPALRDIKVEFKGMKVARVYPESLANVPAGSQQILLGRYLPEGNDQSGEVIVTGTLAGKPVRFSTRATLKDAEAGNSFIPRLWARMHLDSLLEQGTSAKIKDEVIALSEEFQIITPYTSLLVLETDADRARFAVKRQFRMRDGERYFAEGRDNVVFDLTQKQMKKAGAWRTALRRSLLTELAKLGRNPSMFERRRRYPDGGRVFLGGMMYDFDGEMPGFAGSGGGGFPEQRRLGEAPLGELGIDQVRIEDRFERSEELELVEDNAPVKQEEAARGQPFAHEPSMPALATPASTMPPGGPEAFDISERGVDLYADGGLLAIHDDPMDYKARDGLSEFTPYNRRGPYYGAWFGQLFPSLHGAPGEGRELKSTWPAPARELARSLLRTAQLAKLTGGLEIERQTDSFDPRWDELSSRGRRLELVASGAWLTRSAGDGGQTIVSWCNAMEIGVYSKAYQLGRVRASTPRDVQPPPLELGDASMAPLDLSYPDYEVTLKEDGKDRTLLILKHPSTPDHEQHYLIDTKRHVILVSETRHKDKVTRMTKSDDFVEVAGMWWARRTETTDENGKRIVLSTQTVKSLTAKELEQRTQTELADRPTVQLLHEPLPSVLDAKKAVHAGKAKFEDEFVLLLHFQRSQQWSRVVEHLDKAEGLAPGKPGLRWMRSAILHERRRHEELRHRIQAEAARLAKGSATDAYFLAEYLIGQSAGVLEANEMLALLDVMKPVYDNQPPHLAGKRNWLQRRAAYLSQAGQVDEVVGLRKQLAIDYPRLVSLQQEYAQSLAEIGDYPSAYAWLDRVLVKSIKWTADEEESIRSTVASLLQQEGRFTDLAEYVAKWIEKNPPGYSPYSQYLTALLRSDQIDKADTLMAKWLKEGMVAGELSPAAEGRLQAAVNLMMGNAYQLYMNHVDRRWRTPLAEAAVFFAQHEPRWQFTDQIMNQYPFRHSEEMRRARKELAKILVDGVDKLSAEQLQRLVNWVQDEDTEPATWTKIADGLRRRWTSETKEPKKHLLGHAVVTALSRLYRPAETLAFLRLQYEKGPEKHRTGYANQLFESLLSQAWSAEYENEAFALLTKLSDSDDAGRRLFAAVAALHRLTDAMLEGRRVALEKTLEHPEKLTRIELRKKEDEFRKSAREGLADRLHKEAAKEPKDLARWIVAEGLYLDLLLDRNQKQATAAAWEVVGAAPAVPGKDRKIETVLDELLKQRYLVMLTNLAARKNADPAIFERLLKYYDAGLAAQPDDARWKFAKFRLFLALDRTKQLEQTLRDWTRQDDADSRWRIALGYLLAEQGRVADAITQFELVEAADELAPSAYRSLADWYLVQNQRDKYERAAAAVYATMPEHRLSQRISAKMVPWQREDGHVPSEFDPEVLRMFAVLFDKSASPQSYLYQVQQFYQASHDFRLLTNLADAVVGHTAEKVYPFLGGMRYVLDEVRDEATADEIVKRIGEMRPRAKTVVDQRALDLLEALVERRAAEVLNQPGPHTNKALAAMERSFKRTWSPGEPRLMAFFLEGLGRIAQKPLADEQLRELKILHAEATVGSIDRMEIAHRYALGLNHYNRRVEAIDLLQVALDEFQQANQGVLPTSANNTFATFLGFLQDEGHFARAEKTLLAQLEHPVHAQQRRWIIVHLDENAAAALARDGTVSLGTGVALYHALEAKIHKEFADNDQNHRYRLLELLSGVYRTGEQKKFPGVVADLKKFAFETLPPILKKQTNNHESVVSTYARTLYDLSGPRDAIAFMLDRIDQEPRWLRYQNQDGWTRNGWQIASWRMEAKDLGEVEGRLLKMVLKELKLDLESGERRNRAMYDRNNDPGRFWNAKEADFAKTAEAVLVERSQSSDGVQYIAEYFYLGLGRHARAIEILLAARDRKVLEESGEAKLVGYLHEQARFAESIPVLRPLVERRPDHLEYRVQLMHAYFRTGARAELLALLKATDAYFHEKDRWEEGAMARLAASTLQNELYEQSVAYSKEAIPLHERTAPGRGIGDGTLSEYYRVLARAYAGLKKTPEAVDAASAAIVAWGPRHQQRTNALGTLNEVLAKSPDLDAYAAHLDKQLKDTNKGSPILRKALANAYSDKGELAKAIKQYELAGQLQPNDVEIHEALVKLFDKVGDKKGAIRQLLQAVQTSRRELKLYENLGRRFAEAKDAKEAERAYTSIVEMMPNESESHTLLAEVRQKQGRWADAIAEWEQVAALRALEPTGLLKLAAAQIHEKEWDKARDTVQRLRSRSWPTRFGDLRQQLLSLEEKISRMKS